jgi:predicted ATPase
MRPLPTGTVTFLFSDIEGSTRLLDDVGAEAYAEELAEHRRVMREAFAAYGGVEVDTQGDAFFVAFPEARGALDAAAQAQQALVTGPIRVRMGIHSGQPLLTEEGYVGIDVHRGARVMSAGHGGQVLVSEAAYALLDGHAELIELGRHRLKDLTEPQPLYQLGVEEFPPLKTLYQTNLPVQPTPLVGREAELAEVLALLSESRLLTLTGAGGSGKTRLALQAAAELVDDYRDGVWWVSLAALRDPALVEPTIAQMVGAKDGLAEYLRSKQMLLLLDNFEQVIDAGPAISTLLGETPGVRALVTSRERLALSGEQEYTVPTLVSDEAVALFTARARQLEPRFEPDEQVADICRRLDGLPLAVELAAARIKVLTPQQILDRLGQSLALLTGGARDAPQRQQTLKATIEWSYGLLDDDERQLFAGVSVFAGSFDLDAAEAVCGADLDRLQSLIDKSLLRRTEDSRFFMLETIREYAIARLVGSGEAADLERRHASWFMKLGEDAGRGVYGPDQGRLFDALDRDHDNLRAALDWANREHEDELLLRLTSSLGYFWALRGHVEESRVRLARALSVQPRPGREGLRVRVLLFAADDARLEGRPDLAEELITEGLAFASRSGDDILTGRALSGAGMIAGELGNFERCEQLELEALKLFRAHEDGWGQSVVLSRLTDLALKRGDFVRAERVGRDSLKMAEAVAEQAGIGTAHANLALSLIEQQRQVEAREHAAESVLHFAAVGEQDGTSIALELLAATLDDEQQQQAARLLGLAGTLRETLGHIRGSPEQSLFERTVERLRVQLGPEKLAAVFDSVGDLDSAEALAEATASARALH